MFRAGAPVAAAAFFNRAAELAAVVDSFRALAAGAPRWLAVIGPRKVGKTSLLIEAARKAPPKVDVAVLDVMEHAPVSREIFRAMAFAALDAMIAESAGGSLAHRMRDPAEFRALLYETSLPAKLPRAIRAEVERLPDRKADDEAVRAWLHLPEEIALALGRKLVLAVDEVQELASLKSQRFDPFPVMRAIWQRHKAVSYVISGSAPSMLRELVTARHSPFFQHFQLIDVGPFEREHAVGLLEKESPPGRKIRRALADRIFDLVGGHPFYLQLIGESVVALEPPYDEGILKPVLQSLLFSRTGRLALYFENEHQKLVGRATTAAATLQALAAGPPLTLTEVGKAIGSSAPSAARYLDRLGDAVVRGDDARYRLSDPVFATWIRWRSPGGTTVPMKVIGDEAEAAASEALAALGFELVYQSRASRGAFDLLAVRGATQLGVQVKRSRLPVRLTRSEWHRMEGDADRWGWRWAVASVDEAGAVRLLDPAKASRGAEVRLDERAVIDNVLRWLDRSAK